MFEDSMLNENIEMVLKEYYQTVQREDLGANMWASPPPCLNLCPRRLRKVQNPTWRKPNI